MFSALKFNFMFRVLGFVVFGVQSFGLLFWVRGVGFKFKGLVVGHQYGSRRGLKVLGYKAQPLRV